ncbi:DNA-directed RNA polymerase II core subunit rpb9 [Penicillium rubens]|uniref:DNA-directed RNA polymerase subunit n=1 Tax=Penicillium rubens (strain ATCC 28089 / DSM 1075 / NRRL 1951 / Wisconsin 54-1255) TaxID=500485 RepID=B6H263_PENRW|nr:DNA-directed RNA polymerase II core subunit rpb9 [Penicillium rubens]CAP91480.1 Pc13g04110 [Penicillium rubens Wisconsin 54-1255]
MSASPSSTAGGDTKPSDQIHFKFCRECSNLLYPKEDRVNNQLMFTCRTCHVGEPASSHCVYQNHLHSQVGDTAGVTQDVTSDPTLPRANKLCPSCGETEAVFFQSQQRSAETGMKLYYVCCACGQVYV